MNKGNLKCGHCDLVFEDRAFLLLHLEECSGGFTGEIFECGDCKAIYTAREDFEKHIRHCFKMRPINPIYSNFSSRYVL
jgi:uncharacterized C2H2 Zn-finger protein